MSTEYDLELLETKYLAGIQLTESEMIALQEGPRWDAIKRGAAKTADIGKAIATGAGKTIGGIAKGAGAVAGAPQGLGRALKKGYKAGVDTVGGPKDAPAATTSAPAANSKIGQMIQQINALTPAEKQQVVKAVSGGSAAGGSASAPASGAAPKQAAAPTKSAPQPQAATAGMDPNVDYDQPAVNRKNKAAKQQMKLPSKPGEIVTYTNKKGERADGGYVGKTQDGKIQLKKGNATFAIAPQQILGNEPTPTTDQGTLGDIQRSRHQAGLMPDSQFDPSKDAAANPAVAPKVNKTTGSTTPASRTVPRGAQRVPVPKGGIRGGVNKTTGSTKPAPKKR